MPNSDAEWMSHEPSENYQKVHRSYMFASALLAAWEIVGVTPKLAAGDSATGKTTGPVNVEIEIATPEAAVWILLAGVVYFAGRFALVWRQQSEAVKTSPAARLEYVVTHSLGLAAFVAWMVAVLLDVRLGELLPEFSLVREINLFGLGLSVVLLPVVVSFWVRVTADRASIAIDGMSLLRRLSTVHRKSTLLDSGVLGGLLAVLFTTSRWITSPIPYGPRFDSFSTLSLYLILVALILAIRLIIELRDRRKLGGAERQ